MEIVFILVIFFFALTIHEYAHGWVAYKKGDSTAFYSGRLTLNPLAHIDPIGTVLFPIFLLIVSINTTGRPFTLGWAKPVPINYRELNDPKKDIMWVGLAGPGVNILFAVLISIIVNAIPLNIFLYHVLSTGAFINILFAVFNLIPVPPLDGSRVVMGLLPTHLANEYSKLERFGFIILIALLFLGIIDNLVLPIAIGIVRLLGLSVGM